MTTTEAPVFDRVFVWKNNAKRKHLHGRACRVLAYGATRHSVLLEFESGERVITSARAIRRKKKK